MFSQICHKFPGLHESCVILLCAKNIVSAFILSVMFFYNTLSVCTTAKLIIIAFIWSNGSNNNNYCLSMITTIFDQVDEWKELL